MTENKKNNLFSLLNNCHSAMGSRKLMEWIRLPLKDMAQLSNTNQKFFFTNLL